MSVIIAIYNIGAKKMRIIIYNLSLATLCRDCTGQDSNNLKAILCLRFFNKMNFNKWEMLSNFATQNPTKVTKS